MIISGIIMITTFIYSCYYYYYPMKKKYNLKYYKLKWRL